MAGTLIPDPNEDELMEEFTVGLIEAKDPLGFSQAYAKKCPQLAAEFYELAKLQMNLSTIKPPEPATDFDLPRELGDFRIRRAIPGAGMGAVYEATQNALGRRVVIKTIRQPQASPAAEEKFLDEQKVLARLHHTHIVPIFYAGDHAGVKYFVMQYIDGKPLSALIEAPYISQDAAARKNISRSENVTQRADSTADGCQESRVEAVLSQGRASEGPPHSLRSLVANLADVADALQHAHGKGIIHGDVKPQNIMVDKFGKAWIIDFGLAGYLNTTNVPPASSPLKSQPKNQIVGSLPYMSPEQARGGEIELYTDIYGLGVVLYILLTGRRPYERCSKREHLKRIADTETDPPPPHAVCPTVNRDLESICLRAMHKEPGRRYQTAGALREDLRKYLRSEETTARRWRLKERVPNWFVREPKLAWTSAALLLAMIAGSAGIAWQWKQTREQYLRAEYQSGVAVANYQQAKKERQTALTEKKNADQYSRQADAHIEHMSEQLVGFHKKLDEWGRETVAPEVKIELLNIVLQDFSYLTQHRSDGRELDRHWARALITKGQHESQRGSKATALDALRLARELFRSLVSTGAVPRSPGSPGSHAGDTRLMLATTRLMTGIQWQLGDDVVETMLARASLQQLVESHPEHPQLRIEFAACSTDAGILYYQQGENREALALFEEAHEIYEEFALVPELDEEFAESWSNLGLVYNRLGEFEQAKTACENSVRSWRDIIKNRPTDVEAISGIGAALHNHAVLLHDLGQFDRAARLLQSAVEYQTDAIGKEPSIARFRLFLSHHYSVLGGAYTDLQQCNQALKAYSHGRDALKALTKQHPRIVEYHSSLASIDNRLGLLCLDLNEIDQAIEAFAEAEDELQKLLQQLPDNAEHLSLLGGVLNNHALALKESSRIGEALEYFQQAINVQENAIRIDATQQGYRTFLGNHLIGRGQAHNDLRQSEQSLQSYVRARGILDELLDTDPDNREWLLSMAFACQEIGTCLRGVGRPNESLEALQRATDIYRGLDGASARLGDRAAEDRFQLAGE